MPYGAYGGRRLVLISETTFYFSRLLVRREETQRRGWARDPRARNAPNFASLGPENEGENEGSGTVNG